MSEKLELYFVRLNRITFDVVLFSNPIFDDKFVIWNSTALELEP